MPSVLIIGGGIVGCALAYDLTLRGVTVELVERRGLAREASWASAGIISAPTPRLGNKIALSLLAFRRYPQLVAEVEATVGFSTGFVRSGMLSLATSERENMLRESVAWQQEQGVRAQWVTADELRQLEPAVRDGFTGAVWNPDVANLELGKFALALAQAAAQKGATIREYTPVTAIETHGDRATGVRTVTGRISADTIVIAAGSWSRMFSESVGFPIPTRPVRGQMMALANVPIPIRRIVSSGGNYVVPRADGTVHVGATEEHDAGLDSHVTPAGLAELAAVLDDLAPSLKKGRFVSAWAGLRPGSEDGELLVGRVPHLRNVWLATGHFRGGAVLAPATSEVLAESIVSGVVDPRLAPFDPARLA